jgi:hypothetical protein
MSCSCLSAKLLIQRVDGRVRVKTSFVIVELPLRSGEDATICKLAFWGVVSVLAVDSDEAVARITPGCAEAVCPPETKGSLGQ